MKDLSGIWDFKVDRYDEGRKAGWGAKPLTGTMPIPVPASCNDITQDPTIRDHIGDVWYQREFFVPAGWQGKRVELRAGAASYAAILFVNSQEVAQHTGGFLPFGADMSDIVRYGQPNRVTLCVNNVLDYQTLPPGKVNVSHLMILIQTQKPIMHSMRVAQTAAVMRMSRCARELRYIEHARTVSCRRMSLTPSQL